MNAAYDRSLEIARKVVADAKAKRQAELDLHGGRECETCRWRAEGIDYDTDAMSIFLHRCENPIIKLWSPKKDISTLRGRKDGAPCGPAGALWVKRRLWHTVGFWIPATLIVLIVLIAMTPIALIAAITR